jgi:hypothetical protein
MDFPEVPGIKASEDEIFLWSLYFFLPADCDDLVKSRHSGGNRSPGNLLVLERAGFRPPPE